MIGAIVFSLLLQYAVARYNGCPDKMSIDLSCPVRVPVGGEMMCIAMKTAKYGSAYTYVKGDKVCRDDYKEGHLANVYDEETFKKIRCYMIEVADIHGQRDPKVLTGMKYNLKSKATTLYDGDVLDNAFWGENPIALRYGELVIFRAAEEYSRSRLYNFGNIDTRYDRILCEYPAKK